MTDRRVKQRRRRPNVFKAADLIEAMGKRRSRDRRGSSPMATSKASHLILCGDGIQGLARLPAQSVSLVCNDPPWAATKAKWDRELDWGAWWAAIDHALTPDGVLVVYGSVRLALKIIPLARRPFLYDIVWKKNRGTNHLNAKNQPMRKHELLLVFGSLRSYTPQFTYGHAPMNPATRISSSELYGRETVTSTVAGVTHRYQGSVLEMDTVANDTKARIHSSQKPVPLNQWIIRAFSKPGDLVADPTCGSGSLIQAARLEGRQAIGWESDVAKHAAAQAWLHGRDTPLFAERT